MTRAFVIAILGAESTGKTTLAIELAERLANDGHRTCNVSEFLREFCVREERTPRVDEQQPIADEQTRRIEAAAEAHDIVVADTTALQIAVYSDLVFGDRTLYARAEAAQRRCDLTLITALDLPWQPDGLQRDGPHVREPVDTLLRQALQRTGVAYSIVTGLGDERATNALAAVRHAMRSMPSITESETNPRWQWICDRCGDANCERHLLPRTQRY